MSSQDSQHYNGDATCVAIKRGGGMPDSVPARDAFFTEVSAVRNACEACGRDQRIKGDAAAMATLVAIEDAYYRLYLRKPGQCHPTAADFGELLKMVSATPGGRIAWQAFASAFALAVPLQHCVNVAMMANDGTVNVDRSRLPAALALAVAQMPDRGFAAEFRKLALDGGASSDPVAAEFLGGPSTEVVEQALAFAVETLRRQREARHADGAQA